MVAELLAVVGGDHDEGLLPLARRLQRRPDAAQLMIDLADHPEILGLDPGHLGRIAGRGQDPQQPLVQPVPLGRRRDRRGDVSRVVHRREPPGRRIGRVRAKLAQMREPRPRLTAHPADEGVGVERREAVLRRPPRLAQQRGLAVVWNFVAQFPQPADPGAGVMGGEIEFDGEPRQHAFIGLQPWIVRPADVARIDRLVGVANRVGS